MFCSFEEIECFLKERKVKKRIALCGAHDDYALDAVLRAKNIGIAEPVLIGDFEQIAAKLKCFGESPENLEIIHEPREVKAARIAVQMIHEKKADIPMKGLMQSASFLMAIKNPYGGLLKPGGMLNEATIFHFRDDNRLIIAGDCAINIAPTLEEKKIIVRNLVSLARMIGIEHVKVAAISVLEKPNPDIPSSEDAIVLSQLDWGKNTVLEGPLALDNALDSDAAQHKGINSLVAGQANVLLMPEIHSGNILHKAIHFFGHMPFASVACGADVPIIFNSRTDDTDAKYYSILVCLLQSITTSIEQER